MKDSFQDTDLGKSWFDEEKDHRGKRFSRLIFTALIKHDAESGYCLSEISQKILSAVNEISSDGLSGGVVLLLEEETECPLALLGFFELPSTDVSKLLQSVNRTEIIESTNTRILLATDDCPYNEFEKLGIYQTTPCVEDEVNVITEGPTLVFRDMMENLCKESLVFFEKSQEEEGSVIRTLVGLQRKSIPSIRRVVACCNCNHYPTLDEFLDIYDSPIYFDLESERVAPIANVVDWDKVNELVKSTLSGKCM